MKKRMISLCLVLSMVLTFAGCGNESNGSADNTQGTTQQSGTDSNILVAYFSWAENAILE